MASQCDQHTLIHQVPKSNEQHHLVFFTDHNRGNPPLPKIINDKWFQLDISSVTRELSQLKQMVAYRKVPTLRDILVRARIHNFSSMSKSH